MVNYIGRNPFLECSDSSSSVRQQHETFDAFRNLSLNDPSYYPTEINALNAAASGFSSSRNPPEINSRNSTLNIAASEYFPARNTGNERRTSYHDLNNEPQSVRTPPYTMYPNYPRMWGPQYTQSAEYQPRNLAILNDMLDYPYEYMINPEKNYYFKTALYGPRNSWFIDEFVTAITFNKECLVATACHYTGSRMFQLLIKLGKKRAVMGRVPQILADDLELLMTNQSGMHVIKQCFTELEKVKYMPLFRKLIEKDNWFTIALNQIGCRGVNNCISYMVDDLKTYIISRVAKCAVHLALDVYGNYVVQHVIDLDTIYTHEIIHKLVPHLENLAQIRNGSHLLEKCLKTSCWAVIVQQLVNCNKLVRLATHESANYVIQKAIRRSKIGCPELYQKLVSRLCKEKGALEMNKFGRCVLKLLSDTDYQK